MRRIRTRLKSQLPIRICSCVCSLEVFFSFRKQKKFTSYFTSTMASGVRSDFSSHLNGRLLTFFGTCQTKVAGSTLATNVLMFCTQISNNLVVYLLNLQSKSFDQNLRVLKKLLKSSTNHISCCERS